MWALRQFLSLSTGTSFVLNSRNQIIKTLVSSLFISYAVVYKPIIKRMSVEWTPRPVWLNAPQRIMAWPTCEATNQLSTRLFYRESSLFLSNRGGRRRGVAMVSTTFFTVGCEHGRLVLAVTAVNKLRVRSASRWEQVSPAGSVHSPELCLLLNMSFLSC